MSFSVNFGPKEASEFPTSHPRCIQEDFFTQRRRDFFLIHGTVSHLSLEIMRRKRQQQLQQVVEMYACNLKQPGRN